MNSNDCNVSVIQVKNKWKNLKKTYKKIIDHNNMTGSDKASWKFLDNFNEIYGHKSATRPECLYDSAQKDGKKVVVVKKPGTPGGKILKSLEEEEDYETDKKTEEKKSTEAKKGKRKLAVSVPDVFEQFEKQSNNLRQEMREQHTQKMQRLDRFLDLFAKTVEKKDEKKR